MISERSIRNIQHALRARWDQKLTSILQRSRELAQLQTNLEMQKAVQEAYAMGYREGYWDGVVDIVDLSLEPVPEEEISYTVH